MTTSTNEPLLPEFRIGFGAASLSLRSDLDEARAQELVVLAIELGIRLIDTAVAYTPPGLANHNENLIADALEGHPSGEHTIVITKAGHWRTGVNAFPIDGSPARLEQHVRSSLRALRRDILDACLLHWPDPNVPIERSVAALAHLRDTGLIRRIGVSNVSVEQYRRARAITRIDLVENRYSILSPIDPALLDAVEEHDAVLIAYGPLSGPDGSHDPEQLAPLGGIANGRGSSVQQLALAWLLHQSPQIVPIVGATRPQTLAASVAAASIRLDEHEQRELERLIRR